MDDIISVLLCTKYSTVGSKSSKIIQLQLKIAVKRERGVPITNGIDFYGINGENSWPNCYLYHELRSSNNMSERLQM